MLNTSMLVRKINEIINEGQGKTLLSLAVQRPCKNKNGTYDVDLIPCTLSGTISNSIEKYCKIGDVVGVRGSLRVIGTNLNLSVDKVTFLSTKNV